ncbi:MAG TPA: DUF6438 domain-containing protein [bacterium]|jgi:hypothetical protein
MKIKISIADLLAVCAFFVLTQGCTSGSKAVDEKPDANPGPQAVDTADDTGEPDTPAPEYPDSLDNVVITLERTPCYGECPFYTLTINGDGSVRYEGLRFVSVLGPQTDQITEEKVWELVDAFFDIVYFSYEDEYSTVDGSTVTDLPSTFTSITIGEHTKRIRDYYGTPQELKDLADKIDEVVDSAKWVKGEVSENSE